MKDETEYKIKVPVRFRQSDVKILREALAFLGNKQHHGFSQVAIDALKRFGLAVQPYCDHTDWTYVDAENANACLFCGHRFAPTPLENLPIMGGRKK